jgi:hypothetical protein
MNNFSARLQLPSGGFVDVSPESAMPLIKGLTEGTDFVPELVTSLWLTVSGPNGEKVEIVLSPIAGLPPSVSISK